MNKEVIEALTYWLDECPGDVRPSGLLNDLKAARTALQHFKSDSSRGALEELREIIRHEAIAERTDTTACNVEREVDLCEECMGVDGEHQDGCVTGRMLAVIESGLAGTYTRLVIEGHSAGTSEPKP